MVMVLIPTARFIAPEVDLLATATPFTVIAEAVISSNAGLTVTEVVVLGTVFSRRYQESELPVASPMPGGLPTPPLLERWGVWVGLTAVLVVVAYGIPIIQMIQNAPPGSPGFQTW